MREKLPNRREQVVIRVEVNGETYQIGIGHIDGLVKETFGTGPKVGSAMWAILQDVCRSFSRQLQEGVSPLVLAGQAERTPRGVPVSVYGVIADLLVEEQKALDGVK